MDKVTDALVQGLKQAVTEPGEQRLFQASKLPGLFSRAGAGGEAAARAVAEGLLDIVRTETKGKTATEWARPTPKALEFLHDLESPVEALQELAAVLQVNRQQVPLWLEGMQQALQSLS